MDPATTAAYLGCTKDTLLVWEKTLGLPTHRIGTGRRAPKRFYRSEIDEWLKSRCTAPAAGQGRRSA
jgi:excisionase family DNA binding protein